MNDSPLARILVPMRRWWWIIASLVVVTGVVTVLTMPEPPDPEEEVVEEDAEQYRATHLLIRNEAAPTQLTFDLIQLLASQGDLTNRIADVAGEDVSVEDVEMVQLVTDVNTSTMSITALQPTPAGAEQLANIYAQELVAFLDERVLNSVRSDLQRTTEQLQDLEDAADALQQEIDQLPEDDPERDILVAEREGLLNDFASLRSTQRSLQRQLDGATASFITLEAPSPVPVFAEDDGDALSALRLPGRLWVRLVLLTVAAMLVGVVAVLVIDFLDTRIRTRRQAEEAFGLPVLAELPRRRKSHLKREPLPAYSDPGGVTAEALRALRLSLSLAPRWHLTSLARSGGDGAIGAKTPVPLDGDLRSLVVTSPLTGDGKSTLVANLAVSFAEGGKRVLVVDCDFRRPAVGVFLDIIPGPGLRELASVDERPIRDLATPTLAKNVAMVRSGTRGVTPPWFMAAAQEFVQRCTDVADLVIFDTGPINLTNEASALLPYVDTSLVVLRSGRSAPDQARGTVEQLTQVGAHVSGLVLVGSEGRRRYGYGYYGSGRGTSEAHSSDADEFSLPAPDSADDAAAADVWASKTGTADGSPEDQSGEGAPTAPRRRGSSRR